MIKGDIEVQRNKHRGTHWVDREREREKNHNKEKEREVTVKENRTEKMKVMINWKINKEGKNKKREKVLKEECLIDF